MFSCGSNKVAGDSKITFCCSWCPQVTSQSYVRNLQSSRFISPARVLYISGSKLLIMCLLEGSWYRESSKRTSDWNSVSSTMVAGCMSIAIILIRAWSMFVLRVHVGEYFCQVCAISDMVRPQVVSGLTTLGCLFFLLFPLVFSFLVLSQLF